MFFDLWVFLFVSFVKHKCDWDWLLGTVFNDEQEVFSTDFLVFFEDLIGGLLLDLFDGDVLALTAFNHILFVQHEGLVLVVGNEDVARRFKHVIKVVVRVETVVYFYPEIWQLTNYVSVEPY